MAEAYTDQFDQIFSSLADHAAKDYAHHVHLPSFTSLYLDGVDSSGQTIGSIMHECLNVFQSFGWVHDWDASISFKAKQIDALRDARAKWDAFAEIKIDDRQRQFLEVLVHNSITPNEKWITTEFVRVETLLNDLDLASIHPNMTRELAIEELDELVDKRLCEAHKTIGLTEYRATYGGTTWISKAHVLENREIDELRTQGEHDHLDYKRIYNIKSPSEKAELAKDILSFANSAGTVSRILVGVEDNGTFTAPQEPDEHARLLSKLADITLQAIVSERTVIAPSILVQRGNHREGPYVLITITSNVADLPYRFFTQPAKAKIPGASQDGEVWVRHGTSKQRATADEVEAMIERAKLFRSLFP